MTIARHKIATACLVLAATALAGAQDYVTFKDQASQDLFLASRAAVSRSEGSVKTLHSLVMRGRARIVQDFDPPVESEVVIKILMPDAYLRIDTMGTMVKATGFEGNHLLTSITERGESSVPPPSMTASLLRGERARLTRLLLGATAALTPTLRLVGRTAPGIGSMERPGVGAPVGAVYESANELRLIEFSGDEGFYTRFVIDAAKLPVRLEYRATKNEIWTMTFSDRREVGGLLMPYHIVTEGRGAIREDLRFDEIRVNPEIGRGDFKQ
ncbi:MAG TPA: hypothetical protein VF147_14060 [Vicinamibacterales bacterium]